MSSFFLLLFLSPLGKFGPPHGDVPFASSKRSELVVEAPTSKTSNSSTAEKKPRMEESDFEEEEETKHREIEFSQGLPVRGSERNRDVMQPRNTRVEDLKRPGSEVGTWKAKKAWKERKKHKKTFLDYNQKGCAMHAPICQEVGRKEQPYPCIFCRHWTLPQ